MGGRQCNLGQFHSNYTGRMKGVERQVDGRLDGCRLKAAGRLWESGRE
jgi:hypothetical protein